MNQPTKRKRVITNEHGKTKNPMAKVLRYFKPQTFRNKKVYTRKEKHAKRKAAWFNLGDW